MKDTDRSASNRQDDAYKIKTNNCLLQYILKSPYKLRVITAPGKTSLVSAMEKPNDSREESIIAKKEMHAGAITIKILNSIPISPIDTNISDKILPIKIPL